MMAETYTVNGNFTRSLGGFRNGEEHLGLFVFVTQHHCTAAGASSICLSVCPSQTRIIWQQMTTMYIGPRVLTVE